MQKKHTIAFYNIENLFDTKDDLHTNDDAFLPTSEKRWTTKRYQNKIRKLGQVISKIGSNNQDTQPAIVGLAEVENKEVVNDLVSSKHLKVCNYKIIHFDSPDERGIDVALIYNPDVFVVSKSESFSVYLEKENGNRDYTRDILLVSGFLNNEEIHILVNHWSSRREGQAETEHKRLVSASKVNEIITELKNTYNDPKIIVMGDFNDSPQNKSLLSIENESNLFNPFKTISTLDKGSLNHRSQWYVFDQILYSTNFFNVNTTKFSIGDAQIYNSEYLTQYKGKYKGQPFRTYVGNRYKGGYSDHFPVFIEINES